MNRDIKSHQSFINGYQDITFGNFDAILLILMSSVVTSQTNIEKIAFSPKGHIKCSENKVNTIA